MFQRDGVVALKGQSIDRGTCSLGGYKPALFGVCVLGCVVDCGVVPVLVKACECDCDMGLIF